jgi:hypothetical protein
MPMRVRAGTLDDPELMAPMALIWVRARQAGLLSIPRCPSIASPPGSPLVEG